MSIQFGRWNFKGQPPSADYIEKVSAVIGPYGPDSNEAYSEGGVKILYRAFRTTKEACRETQPHICPSGAVITWDGRLDNRAELISELRDSVAISATDVAIVEAAYEKWGTNCFAKIIGDWALSIWDPVHRSLVLAKDPIGVRHLYYSIEKDQIIWSTLLEPLVRFAGKTFSICEEYIAGWLAILFPAAHLTPYVGIHPVPPSCSVLLRPGKHTVSKYWDFDPGKRIRYRTDGEYEEHFRTVFGEAVRRRLRSNGPILAELSGGMDSSSIVCMADIIIARGAAGAHVDTLSWFDDSDPDMDERAYFAKVEEKRGRTGCHINLGAVEQRERDSQKLPKFEFGNDRFAVTPMLNRWPSSELFKQYAAYLRSHPHRVTLSGIGGGEVTGGNVPTPTPELQNLLARARFFTLARQLKAWADKMRKPQFPLLWDAIRGFFPGARVGVPKDLRPAPWLHADFVRRNHAALHGYPMRLKLFGPLPSFQHNLVTLDDDRRFFAGTSFSSELLREVRYPYLDRSLLEFSYAIPWEQIVRIGQRRSLMKRALIGIVPNELLNRKRKAAVAQRPQDQGLKNDMSKEWCNFMEIGRQMASDSIGVVHPNRFLEALRTVRCKEEDLVSSLSRALTLESWLRHLTIQGVRTTSMPTTRQGYSSSANSECARSSNSSAG